MELVQVDAIGAEAPQAVLARLSHPARAPTAVLRVVVERTAELGRDHDIVPARAKRLAEELLGLRAAVEVGGVEEVDACVERSVDHRGGLVLIDAHAEVVRSQAAQRHVERTDLPRLHRSLLAGYGKPRAFG